MPPESAGDSPGLSAAVLRDRLGTIPFINENQQRRWLGLLPALDAVRGCVARTGGHAADQLAAAQRLLGTTTFRVAVFGRTGDGKSSLINALIGRALLDTGPVAAITGTVVYVEPVPDAAAPEELVIDYLSEQELQERVRSLATDPGKAGLDRPYDILDRADRRVLAELIAAAEQSPSPGPQTQRTAMQLIRHCLDAYEANQGRYQDGQIPSDTYPLAELTDDFVRDLLRESPDLGTGSVRKPPRAGSQLRLIRSARFRIRPGAADSLFAGGALTIVDVPGFGASMPWHELIARTEIQRQESLVLLVLNLVRIETAEALEAAGWLADELLGPLTGAARDLAAGKVFVAVNNFAGYGTALDGIDDPDVSIGSVLARLSPGYWDRYRHRGQDGRRPYIITMPLAAVQAQDPQGAARDKPNPYQNQTAEARRRIGAAAAELPPAELTAQIVDVSGIRLLRENIEDYLRHDLIDAQLAEVAARLLAAADSAVAAAEKQLTRLGLRSPFGESSGLAEEQFCRAELDRLAGWGSSRERDDSGSLTVAARAALAAAAADAPQQGSIYQADVNGELQRIKDLVDERVTGHRMSRTDYEARLQVTDTARNTVLLQCQADFRDFLHHAAFAAADARLAVFRSALRRERLRERLRDASFGQEYCYPLAAAPGRLTLEAVYGHLLDRFGQDYRNAYANAVSYEDLRGDRRRLFTLAGKASSADPEPGLAVMIKEAYGKMLVDIGSMQAADGLEALFGRHLTLFDRQLVGIIDSTLQQHQESFRHNTVLRANILARTGPAISQVKQLLDDRAAALKARAMVVAAMGSHDSGLPDGTVQDRPATGMAQDQVAQDRPATGMAQDQVAQDRVAQDQVAQDQVAPADMR